jgi:hypothetical protein
MLFGSSIIHIKRKKLTFIGLNATFYFIINSILQDMGGKEIEAFLTDLAVNQKVAAST